jgi:hypothetical protein
MMAFGLTMPLKRISLLSGKAGMIEDAECTSVYRNATPHSEIMPNAA